MTTRIFEGPGSPGESETGNSFKGCPTAQLLGIVRESNRDLAEGYGPAIQEAEIVAYCASNHYQTIAVRHITESATIALEDRELFRAAIAEAIERHKAGNCDGVALAYTKRLGRRMGDALQVALDLHKAGLEIHLIREKFILKADDEPLNLLLLVIHAYQADLDTRIVFRSTKEGQYRTARAGRLPGGVGPGILGYDLVGPRGDKHFQPNLKIGMVDKVLELAKAGASINQIVRELQARGFQVTRRTIQNILRHARVYAGEYRWGGIVIANLVPPRIAMADADEIETKRQRNKERSLGFGKKNWLSGRVRCGLCGRSYLLSPSHNQARCSGTDHLGVLTPCVAPVIKYTDLDYAVWCCFLDNLLEPEAWNEKFDHVLEEQQHAREKLEQECLDSIAQFEKLESIRKRLSWQHANGLLSDEQLAEQLRDFAPQYNLLRARCSELKDKVNHPERTATFEELKRAINQLVSLSRESATGQLANDVDKAEFAEKFDLQVTVMPGQLLGFALKIFATIPLMNPEPQVYSSELVGEPIVYQSSR